jgi:predicted ATPase
MKGGEGIPARHVSEGTLVTLALLVVLAGPNPPGLVLIENLERGLHPKALRDLVDQIRLLQKQNPKLQVVATSHSPYLLDYVEADEILLTSLGEDGYASVKALSEHPEYDRWKDVMAPGEFWSTVGESWVVQKT